MADKISIFVLTFLCFILFAAGCQPARYYAEPSDSVYFLADFHTALTHWSAHGEIHHNLIGIADINAVYLSWEVRQAYLHQLESQLHMPEQELAMNRKRQLHRHEDGNEFLLGIYCYKKEWEQLDGIDPLWRLTLETDSGESFQPELIEAFEIPKGEELMYYSFLKDWRTMYRIVFPKLDSQGKPVISSSTKFFRIACNSVLGHINLNWKMQPVPGRLQ